MAAIKWREILCLSVSPFANTKAKGDSSMHTSTPNSSTGIATVCLYSIRQGTSSSIGAIVLLVFEYAIILVSWAAQIAQYK